MTTQDDHSLTLSPLPKRIKPMMLGHLLLTGEVEQHREWQSRLEAIAQSDAVTDANDPEIQSLLAKPAVWKRMRETGKFATLFAFAPIIPWLFWLIPVYANVYGFGWLAALTYLLPIPIAYRVGRKLWEKSALLAMQELGERPSAAAQGRTLANAVLRAFGAGYVGGALLVLAQGLISWFMTPAPTLITELMIDGAFAAVGGAVCGAWSVLATPFIARSEPVRERLDARRAAGLLESGEHFAD